MMCISDAHNIQCLKVLPTRWALIAPTVAPLANHGELQLSGLAQSLGRGRQLRAAAAAAAHGRRFRGPPLQSGVRKRLLRAPKPDLRVASVGLAGWPTITKNAQDRSVNARGGSERGGTPPHRRQIITVNRSIHATSRRDPGLGLLRVRTLFEALCRCRKCARLLAVVL